MARVERSRDVSAGSLPWLARELLRVLPASRRAEAIDDLLDLHARASASSGEGAAGRACVREALLMVAWSAYESRRRRRESRPMHHPTRKPAMLADVAQDLRFAVRALGRRPGFALITISVLGLGIGANVTIFTLADRLFRDAPGGVANAHELVGVFRSWGVPDAGGSLSYPDYVDYRAATRTLSGLAAFSSGTIAATARVGGSSAPARLLTVTDNYFRVLGVDPAAGRFFRPEENRTPDTHPVAVVSWRYWMDRMGGAEAAPGAELVINGQRFTVIGVVSPEFLGLSPASPRVDVYIPIMMRNAVAPASDTAWRERVASMRDRWVGVIGRLTPGATVESVQAELGPVATRIRETWGGDSNESVLVSAQFRWYPGTRASLSRLTRMLLAAVGLLLAIAIANVAILQIARASARDRELGIRAALGAGRGRIARQLLAESLVIGGAGCIVGVALSTVAARVAAAWLPVSIHVDALPDARALLFAFVIALFASVLVGIAPAARGAGRDVLGLIQGRDRHAGGGRVRDGLVVLQVALSLVLVAGAVMFARSLSAARSVDTGFDDRGVLIVGVNLANHGYDAERGRVFLREAIDRLTALPAVSVATITRQVPFGGDWTTDLAEWPGADFAGGRDTLTAGLNVVAPGYFEGMGIPVLRGRAFDRSDDRGTAPVVIINETFARLAFGDADPLGLTVPLRDDWPPMLIAGVVRDAKYYQLDEAPWPQIYAPIQQFYMARVHFLVRTEGDAAALARPVQRALLELDPALAFEPVETLSAVKAEQVARFRTTAHLVGLTGLIALFLACAGLYGVMAWRVSRRTRELGLRMALGATRRGLAADVLGNGLRLAAAGVLIGLAAALLLGRLVEGMLFGVHPRDPVSLLLAPILLVAVAAASLVVPARRAMRVDPLIAMRAD